MKYKLTFALVASLTSTAFAEFKAPLPEFKNEKQLAEWRAGKASESTNQGYAAEESAFYTGRPYIASAESYAFKFRSYYPAAGRWTSEDPSGYPDGANGNVYAPTPTAEFDFQGLETQAAHRDIIINIFGTDIAGEWNGNYVWSFAEGSEMAKITPDTANDGFTGFLGIPLTVEIGGVTVGIGSRVDAIYNNTSSLTTEMRNGVQWKKYVVELEVKFKKNSLS